MTTQIVGYSCFLAHCPGRANNEHAGTLVGCTCLATAAQMVEMTVESTGLVPVIFCHPKPENSSNACQCLSRIVARLKAPPPSTERTALRTPKRRIIKGLHRDRLHFRSDWLPDWNRGGRNELRTGDYFGSLALFAGRCGGQ